MLTAEGWLDVRTSMRLWDEDFLGPQAVIRRGLWVDRASVGIPYIYISTAISLAQVLGTRGDTMQANRMAASARSVARATGLEDIFTTRGGDRP